MKRTTIALLLAFCACQKAPIQQPANDNPVERAKKSPDVAKFYELTRSEAALLRMKVLDSAKLRDLLSQQNEVMSRVRLEFKGVHFTQAMTEAIFSSQKKLAARTPYTIDTNCKLQWDEMNNGCWNSFLWGQWWGFLGGFLTWGTTINNAATFRSCTVAAEAEYYYCSGD